jgi:hypothetical protein
LTQFQVEEIRKGLETLGLEICEMDNTDAYLEGGDFLYTGLFSVLLVIINFREKTNVRL